MKHFLTLNDIDQSDIIEILNLAKDIKKETKAKVYTPYLKDQILAMIFEKSSTRTRLSFEVGMHQLGGKAIFLSSSDTQMSRGESIKDSARVLGSMVDMIMARVYKQGDLEEFAKFSKVPTINGLSDDFHPVQLMADLMTLSELGLDLQNMKVAFVGDGNNMANSWLMAASKLGFKLQISTPKGYEPKNFVIDAAMRNAKLSGAKITISNDPKQACQGAEVVTTDTWISMGEESKKVEKIKDFSGYCVDEKLMSLAQDGAKFLHCLPAYKGLEVSETTFEKHSKEIFSQAENRLHAQKGIMVWCDRKRNE